MSRHLAISLNICAALLAAAPLAIANTAGKGDATKLPAGEIACITLHDAQNYTSYSKEAPKFAADLLDRAACYKTKEAMDAIVMSQEKGFTSLKLLSGHVVWIPSGPTRTN